MRNKETNLKQNEKYHFLIQSIKAERVFLGLSREEFCNNAGLALSTLSAYETFKRKIPKAVLISVLVTLKMDKERFLKIYNEAFDNE